MAEIKIVSMIREVPEVPGSPTKMDVQECDVEKLAARGWKVAKKETEMPVEDTSYDTPVAEETSSKKKNWSKK